MAEPVEWWSKVVVPELALPPGPELVSALAGLEVTALSYGQLLDVAGAWERARGWLDAQQNSALVELDRAEQQAGGERAERQWCREELAVELGVAPMTAHHRLEFAHAAAVRVPVVGGSLAAGEVSAHHVRLLIRATERLSDEEARVVDARVYSAFRSGRIRTPGQFKRYAQEQAIRVNTAAAAQRHAQAVADRSVWLRALEDGMAALTAVLPAEDARTVAAAVEARARSSRDHTASDQRTLPQLRADALTALAADALNAADAPTIHRRRPTVHVTLAMSTALGLDDEPAQLAGYGAIDAETARRIAADPSGTWRRVLVDPVTGRGLDYGRSTYRPPADLAGWVAARDAYCVWPNCDTLAHLCDIDHRVEWDHGGTTCPNNNDPLCQRHHPMKSAGYWTHIRAPSGESIWITSQGRHVRKPAHRLPVGTGLAGPDPPF